MEFISKEHCLQEWNSSVRTHHCLQEWNSSVRIHAAHQLFILISKDPRTHPGGTFQLGPKDQSHWLQG